MSALLAALERGEAGPAGFHHADHIRLAWEVLGELPFAEAALRVTSALRRFAAGNGRPELYHETITWAYLVVIAQRLEHSDAPWEEFAAANPDLFCWRPSLLDRLYRPATLASDLARRLFLLPDAGIA